MRKIKFLLSTLVLLLGAVTASAADVTVYIDPVGDGTWLSDNAKISVNVFTNGDTNNTFFTPTVYKGNVLKVTFPDTYNRMIIVRGENQDAWGWNQTEDITPVDNTLYKANGYFGDQMVYTTVNPYLYVVDFNTAITTSNHDFAVASNWKHIVGSNNYDGYGPYYMQYGYTGDGGVDGTGALRVGAQNGYYAGSTQSGANFTDGHYDHLVTPKVNGTVTLKVKRYNVTGYPSYVRIFKCNEEGNTIGDEIVTDITPAISDSEWSTLTLTLTEETRLAIRAQSVLLDNFTAEEATIIPIPAMSITSIKRADDGSTTYFDMNADGGYTVKYKVKITNTGETNLIAGTTENYSLSVSIDDNTYGTFDVPVDVEMGNESEEFVASIVVPKTAPTGWKYRYLKENLTNTVNTNSIAWSNTIEYNPIPFFIKQGNEPISKGSSLTSVTSLDYGMITSATTENYEIFAHNAGDLQIKSITTPDGFTAVPAQTLPYTIPAHTGMNVDVTANGTATASGNMVITYVDKNGVDQTVNISLSQTVIDPSKWLATFDNGIWPEGTIHQSSLSLSSNSYYGYTYAIKSSSSYNNKFFTPLLHATAGESMTFDAMLDYSYGSIKVYVTTDRNNLGTPVLTLGSSQLNTSSMTSKSVTIADEGDYYVVFEVYYAMLDNLYGFELVPVDHDIVVNSFKIGYNAEDKEIKSGTEQSFSFDIVSTLTETADAYSVKLYANGSEVATAEAADLTAGTSKTFNFTWTPTVETTTVYEMHAAIVFTDETVIVSPSLNLTVTKEPKFVFVTSSTTVTDNTTSITTAQTFGKVNTHPVKSFKIHNSGTANLLVSSIVAPAGFSVDVNGPLNLGAGEEQIVNVTFSTETPGEYAGNLTITYNQDGEQEYTLAFSGTMLDPTKFYANFDNATESCNWPAGSIYQNNISGATVSYSAPYNYYISSSSTTNNIFVTPKLAATAGEKLMFDAKLYYGWNSGAVKVYAATTREEVLNTEEGTTRVQLFYASGVDAGADATITTDYQTFEVTVPEAGEYYFGFEISGRPYVDEINGLTPVAVAHDWKIASSNIPTDAMQNVATEASVNVLNLGLADEAADSYEVNLYIDGEKTATAATIPALPMAHQLSAAGTQVTVPIYTLKTGTFPVYIEVKAGDYSVTTDPVDVTFAEEFAESNLTMSTGTASNTNLLHLNWNNSETVSLYSATVLSNMGLKEGDKISSITYKGYNKGSNYSTTLNVWYEFTDETTQSQPAAGKYDTSEMTNVLNTTRSWASVEGTSSNYVELITINFKTPIVYTAGKSLRMVVCSEGSQYQSGTYFVQSTVSGTETSYYNRNDDATTFKNTQTWAANTYLPAIYIGVVAEPKTYSGTITDEDGKAIENATVSLVSTDGKNVQYSAITDENGAYSINVVQSTREYDATATAYGYNDGTHNDISFAADVNKDFKLESKPTVSVTVTSAEWATITTPATYAVSFDENTEAYIATAEEGNSIKLTKIDVAPAMTPIVIHTTADACTMTQETTAASDDVSANILKSAKGNEVGDGNGNYYVLGMNSSNVVGFGPLADGVTLAKGKAYLVPTSGSGFLTFVIGDEDETTTINAVDAAGMDDDTPVYNLAGQKVGKDYKGVVIVNGRKVVRK